MGGGRISDVELRRSCEMVYVKNLPEEESDKRSCRSVVMEKNYRKCIYQGLY